MGHPASYFIKYILLEHYEEEDFDNEALDMTLLSYGLPTVSEHEYMFMRLALNPPDTLSFANRKHRDTVKFMKEEGLYTLWAPKGDDKRVMPFLLPRQRARFKIDIMLMGGVPSKFIASKINAEFRWRDPLTAQMVETYHHFFWNTDLPSLREWNSVLLGHPQRDAMMSAYYCGADQAMYRVGGNPKIADPKLPLREANRQAYWVLQALRYEPDTSENIKLRSRIGQDLRALHDAIHGEGADTDEQLRKFRQFLVEKHPAAVAQWDELAGPHGSYSGDGKGDQDDDE